jgi:hypothetical protein
VTEQDGSTMELRQMVGLALLRSDFTGGLISDPETGEVPIVLARVEDPMSAIFKRWRENDGAANFVCRWEGGLAVLSLGTRADPPADGDQVQPIGLTATLGTLLAVMAQSATNQTILRPTAPIDGRAFLEGTRHTVAAGC